jgi:NADPH:quinone reductase-like Zn-dependent oxidoreductase
LSSSTLNVRAGEQVLVHGAGGVTGALLVALAALRGAQVIATAGPASRQRVTEPGARQVIDCHDQYWPARVRVITANRGVGAAANAVPGGAAGAIEAVADGGRLATITSDPPGEQRGITVSSIYVRRTETSCARWRHGWQTASWRSRSPPATVSPMLPRHSPW